MKTADLFDNTVGDCNKENPNMIVLSENTIGVLKRKVKLVDNVVTLTVFTPILNVVARVHHLARANRSMYANMNTRIIR